MKKSKLDLEVKVERTIAASPAEVYRAWLDPKVPGTPWHEGDELLLNPKVDGFFYWLIYGTAHYGRFTALERGRRIRHTWMSRYTEGEESTVTVTFAKRAEGTLMTLLHTGLPNNAGGRGHEEGWNQFLDKFPKHFGKTARKGKKPSKSRA
jgi:uncharacterized protein YndB with AHSA1/START domain